MRQLNYCLALIVAGLLIVDPAWSTAAYHADRPRCDPSSFAAQALSPVGIIAAIRVYVPRLKIGQIQMAARIRDEFGIVVKNPFYAPVDYLEAIHQLLRDLRDEGTYDLRHLHTIEIIPWYWSLGDGVSEWFGIERRTTLGYAAVVAHWLPSLFLRDLSVKIATALQTHDDFPSSMLARQWTATDIRSWLGRWTVIEAAILFMAMGDIIGRVESIARSHLPMALRIGFFLLAMAGGIMMSYVTNGMVSRTVALLRGRRIWVLDPAKWAPLRPAAALSNPAFYMASAHARALPHVPAERLFRQRRWVAYSLLLHAGFGFWLIRAFAIFADAAPIMVLVLVISAGSTIWRIVWTPRGAFAPSFSRPVMAFQAIGARIILYVQEACRWAFVLGLIGAGLAFTDGHTRNQARKIWDDYRHSFQPSVHPRSPLDGYSITFLGDPRKALKGQAGNAADVAAARRDEAFNREKPIDFRASDKNSAHQPKLVYRGHEQNIPMKAGEGGIQFIPWSEAYYYQLKVEGFDHISIPQDQFGNPMRMPLQQLQKYGMFWSNSDSTLDGQISGCRLVIDDSDEGWIDLRVNVSLGDGRRILFENMNVRVKKGPQTLEFHFGPQNQVAGFPDAHMSQSIHVQGGPIMPTADQRPLIRIHFSGVEWLSTPTSKTSPKSNPDTPDFKRKRLHGAA